MGWCLPCRMLSFLIFLFYFIYICHISHCLRVGYGLQEKWTAGRRKALFDLSSRVCLLFICFIRAFLSFSQKYGNTHNERRPTILYTQQRNWEGNRLRFADYIFCFSSFGFSTLTGSGNVWITTFYSWLSFGIVVCFPPTLTYFPPNPACHWGLQSKY